MAFWGNLEGTLKNLFSIGKTNKISIENDSGEAKVNLGSTERLRVKSDGSLSVAGTTDYENLVTDDDDLPNKKYVDDINSYTDSPMLLPGSEIDNATFYAGYAEDVNGDWGDGTLTGTGTGSPVITDGELDLSAASVQHVDYPGTGNISTATQTGCVRFIYTPDYSGTPSGTRLLFLCCKADSDWDNEISIEHLVTSGNVNVRVRDSVGGFIFYTQMITGWSPTAGTPYEFELNWDLTSGATRLFVDGVQQGPTDTHTGTRDSSVDLIRLGSDVNGTEASDCFYDRILIFDTVQHTSGYTPDWSGILPYRSGIISEGTNAGTFQHTSLAALLRNENSVTGNLTFVEKAAEDNIAITAANTTYYVSLNYNSGSPTITVSTTNPYDSDYRNIPIGKVMKDGSNNVHYVNSGFRLSDGVEKLHQRSGSLKAYELASGNTIAYSGTNNFTMAAGVVYAGANRITQDAYDSAVTTFIPVYSDGGSGWTEDTPRNTIDYTKYDDGDGVLGDVGVSKYGCHWVYRHIDSGDVYVVYGVDSYNLAEALTASEPDKPIHLSDFGVLIGRIVAPQAGGSFSDIAMVTDVTFTGTATSDHGNLGGLADDDHTQYLLADGSRDMTVANEGNETFTVNQNDTTNNPAAFKISNTGTGNCLEVNSNNFVIDANGNIATKHTSDPNYSILNSTAEDTDGGRESHVRFRGTQSGNEITTLVRLTGQHEGTSDDEKGAFTIQVNDGNDGDAPTERFRIESNGTLNVSGTTDYENLVTSDDDIPNKKYVDDNAGGSVTWETKDDDFSAVSGYGYRVDTDTNTKIVTATLPGSPSTNDEISFLDLKQNFGTYAVKLGRNSLKIMGLEEDFSADVDNFNFTVIYTGATDGWIIK